MRKLFKDNSFTFGFIIGILLFIIADISMKQVNNIAIFCFDCFESYEISVSHYESESLAYIDEWLRIGLVINIVVALFSSFILGLIIKSIWSNILEIKAFVWLKISEMKAFYLGVILVFIASLFVQIISYADYVISKSNFKSPPGLHMSIIWSWGVPFPIVYGGSFNLAALIVDILITLIFSLIVGLVFKFVWSKISARKSPLK